MPGRRARRRSLGALAALAALAWAPATVDEPLPRGRVIERIACLPDPSKSYALYLPSTYDAARRWPILYVLDPRGRAPAALEIFRGAAERAGWILASSYDTASDRQDDPNTPAVNALWGDTRARLALDPRRAYVAGFSGTGRVAVSMAYAAPDRIAGVIDCGAGFPFAPEKTSSPFPLFFAVGEKDFNYLEVRKLDGELDALSFRHRVETFDAGHEWLPPEMVPVAMAWLDLAAMRTGALPKDSKAVEEFARGGLARAAAHEAAGRLPEAFREAQTLGRDLESLGDAAAAQALLARLTADPSVQKALREERKSEERERRDLRAIVDRLRGILAGQDPPPPSEAARQLGVPPLRRRAAAPERRERLPATRLLAEIAVQTGFYLPEQALQRGDRPRALYLYRIAREADPESPAIPYRIAAVQSQSGDVAAARRSLEEAVALGFTRFDLLETGPDFANLRQDPAFRQWLQQRRHAPVTPTPPAAATPAAGGPAGATTGAPRGESPRAAPRRTA